MEERDGEITDLVRAALLTGLWKKFGRQGSLQLDKYMETIPQFYVEIQKKGKIS